MRAVKDSPATPLRKSCDGAKRKQKALVGRAQSRIDQASLENEMVEEIARAEEGGREWPGALLARRTRTIRRMGRPPTLVLCSRNARPKKEHERAD